MRGRCRTGLALALLAAAMASGCGAAGGSSASPAPAECLKSWNAGETSLRFGRHVYDTHESHRAQVGMLEAVDGNPNVAAGGACAVIFAVPESDVEYGAVGLVETELGWASMQELAREDPEELGRIQGEASTAANATLFPDGSLEPN